MTSLTNNLSTGTSAAKMAKTAAPTKPEAKMTYFPSFQLPNTKTALVLYCHRPSRADKDSVPDVESTRTGKDR